MMLRPRYREREKTIRFKIGTTNGISGYESNPVWAEIYPDSIFNVVFWSMGTPQFQSEIHHTTKVFVPITFRNFGCSPQMVISTIKLYYGTLYQNKEEDVYKVLKKLKRKKLITLNNSIKEIQERITKERFLKEI